MLNIFWVELGFALIVLCALPWYCTLQGLGTHLKASNLVAGFANSNRRKLCNAKFMTINDEIFLVAIKPVKKGKEVFVYYKIR